jgi:hypothetical protein
MTPLDAARAVLHRLNIPESTNRLVGLVAFAAEEGGHWNNSARYNPWNTTLSMPGARSVIGAVKAYPDWQTGIEATARTMAQDNMRPIVNALKADASPRAFLVAVTSTPWCPRTDANGNPTGCQAYENVDPYALYKSYANKSDGGGTLAKPSDFLKTWGPWLVLFGLVGAGGLVWYYSSKRRGGVLGILGAEENPRRSSRRRGRGRSRVQTLIFPRSRFTPSSAKAWARKHRFKSGKVDITGQSIRIRQLPPGGFSRMRTISLGPSVKAVVGFR